ncbi:ThiJ/PfpI domain-containing protein [Protomyces lactucae-debilis]|uniref:D-lactate dehydratase n=1 Tax=Protomyces lactucae-debilis TaxID=2754530 RepID=A0A1Y2F5M5_PROLT|nr:ThiJ/PfpI domain-containing protein [Protomyces lactucae-debilis]ORY78235.1 ThiJ/PfpI domain-containing protein [Protomyces lactucae-debilis]
MEAIKNKVASVTGKKVLFVLTSHDQLLSGKPTGWYLPEFCHPYAVFKKAGYAIDIASPKGGKAPLDPSSIDGFKDDAACKEYYLENDDVKKLIDNTTPLFEIQHTAYAAIFTVGGHGPCFDLYKDVNFIELTEKFIAAGKPVSAVCHGPVVFVNVKNPDGTPFVQGKKITCFTDEEERQAQKVEEIPFLVETKLKELGAKFENTEAWGVHTVRDGQLITGQNPASAEKTAELLLAAIKEN